MGLLQSGRLMSGCAVIRRLVVVLCVICAGRWAYYTFARAKVAILRQIMDQANLVKTSFPVAVILEKYLVERAFWSLPEWRLYGIVAGEEVAGGELNCQQVRNEPGAEHFLWRGLTLRLHLDGCESYWLNLISDKPVLYLVCEDESEDAVLRPLLISADSDEASAYLEGEGRVLQAPIPPEIYKAIEAFVLQHFQPEQLQKRKRKRWDKTEQAPSDKLGLRGTVLGVSKRD